MRTTKFAFLFIPFTLFLLITIQLQPVFTASQSDPIIQRCRYALKKNINLPETRREINSLIKEIQSKREKYLEDTTYPDVRLYYEKLQARMGNYYYKNEDYKNALESLEEADKYAVIVAFYKERIHRCRNKLGLSDISDSTRNNLKNNLSINLRDNTDETIAFLEKVHRYVISLHPRDNTAEIIRELIGYPLNGPKFRTLTDKHRNIIPKEYDALMNHFFHVLFTRRQGWEKKAQLIIKAGDWNPTIKKKMKRFLEETKLVF